MTTTEGREVTTDVTTEKYTDKIAKLLRKAESTTPEEAAALIAKAQELMMAHSISEDMIRAAGKKTEDPLVKEHVDFTGIYQAATYRLAHMVANENGVRSIYTEFAKTSAHPKMHRVYLLGYKSDVDAVTLLVTSLQLQMAAALNEWQRVNVKPYWSKMDKFKQSRAFLVGYIDAVWDTLRAGRRAAVREAEIAHTKESVALAIRDKKANVDDWFDKHYAGSVRPGKTGRFEVPAGGRHAGQAAGRNANINRPSVGGQKGIGR